MTEQMMAASRGQECPRRPTPTPSPHLQVNQPIETTLVTLLAISLLQEVFPFKQNEPTDKDIGYGLG